MLWLIIELIKIRFFITWNHRARRFLIGFVICQKETFVTYRRDLLVVSSGH